MSLTMGELRFIDESTNTWKMDIKRKAAKMGIEELSPGTIDRMFELAGDYKAAFCEFYEKAKEAGDERDNPALQASFNEQYQREHPEFFDFNDFT